MCLAVACRGEREKGTERREEERREGEEDRPVHDEDV
jgi:hypothetical protein